MLTATAHCYIVTDKPILHFELLTMVKFLIGKEKL